MPGYKDGGPLSMPSTEPGFKAEVDSGDGVEDEAATAVEVPCRPCDLR